MYDAPLVLHIDIPWKDWFRYVESTYGRMDDNPERNSPPLGEFRWHTNLKTKKVDRVIWLPSFKHSIKDMGVLLHEVVHYVTNVCYARDIKMEWKNDEPLTWLIEYTFRECLEALKK